MHFKMSQTNTPSHHVMTTIDFCWLKSCDCCLLFLLIY